jgi:hypothetical protein
VAQPPELLLVNGYEGDNAAERAALAGVPADSRLVGAPGAPRKALVMYGMGNFCSTMFNELCRVGLLATLQLAPPAPGGPPGAPWRWTAPAWHWCYNEARVLRGGAPRTLLAVRSCGAGAPPADRPHAEAARLCGRKRALVDYMVQHVLGSDSDGSKRARPEQAKPPRFYL